MSFVLTNLLHDAKKVDGRKKVAPGEFGNRFRINFGALEAKFFDFCISSSCMLAFLKRKGWKLIVIIDHSTVPL